MVDNCHFKAISKFELTEAVLCEPKMENLDH